MREIVKLASRLLIITLIAGLLLAATNEITKGPIAQQSDTTAQSARNVVLPTAQEFEKVEDATLAYDAVIDAVYRGIADGEVVGYAFSLSPMGYKDEVLLTLGITRGGAISGLTVDGQSETAGLGTKITEPSYLNQYIGKAADATLANQVDAIAGATVSSKAVLDAVRKASDYAAAAFDLVGEADDSLEGNIGTAADETDAASGATAEGTDATSGATPGNETEEAEIAPYAAIGYDRIRAIHQTDGGYRFDLSAPGFTFTAAFGGDGLLSSLALDEAGQAALMGEDISGDFVGQGADAIASATFTLDGEARQAVAFGVRQAADFYRNYLADREG